MKKLCLILMLFVLTACPSPYWDDRVNIAVTNNSDTDIACFFPRVWDYPVEGYPYHVYPDTTITFARHFVQYPFKAKSTKDYVYLCYHDVAAVYEHYKTDTLSFFIFDNSLIDRKGMNDWEWVQKTWDNVAKNYKVMARYDLSLKDLRKFSVSNTSIAISYPPTPEMKDVKMWPPYEELIENAEKTKL